MLKIFLLSIICPSSYQTNILYFPTLKVNKIKFLNVKVLNKLIVFKKFHPSDICYLMISVRGTE